MVDSSIKEVSFSVGNHTLINDENTKDFLAPQWTRDPINSEPTARRFPIAYTKHTKPTVEMTFNLDLTIPAGHSRKAEVRATGSDGVDLPKQTIFNIQDGPHDYTYPATLAGHAFPDQIRFYGPTAPFTLFTLTWWIKIGDAAEIQLGSPTQHRLYLTAGTPTCVRGNRETFFYYACHKPHGNPGTVEKDVTYLIWDDFKVTNFVSQKMRRINHDTGSLRVDVGQTSEVLNFITTPPGPIPEGTNAVCAGWADFFIDVLRVHHYEPVKVKVAANANMTLPVFVNHGLNNAAWLTPDQNIGANGRTVSPGPIGIAKGQGDHGDRKTSAWSEHSIVRTCTEYFDPSYGIGKCKSEIEYESNATSGFQAAKPNELGENLFFYWSPPPGIKTLDYIPPPPPPP